MDFKQKYTGYFLLTLALLIGMPSKVVAQEASSFTAQVEYTREMGYALHQPKLTDKKMPLVVFLHGSGEKGTNIADVIRFGPYRYIVDHQLPMYVLAPQCREGDYWDSESLYQLIQKVVKENQIDPSRIYLTGLSMGAWGALNLAFAHPELFAALVPIAGFVDRIALVEHCKIKHIPIRMFHGLLDDVVSVDYSKQLYEKLKSCHPDIQLTIFDDANHDSWSRVYNTPEIYTWLLQQTQTKP